MVHNILNVDIDYKKLNLENGDHQATMTLYVPDNFSEIDLERKRPTVIICPGGAYSYTSAREAEPGALNFITADFNAIVLNYSCAPAVFPCALFELASTIKTVKENAQKWHVDTDKIFVMGFSAGGHLAASYGTYLDSELVKSAFADCDLSIAGMILSYPVITSGEKAHRGSFDNLLGEKATDEKALKLVSLEQQVSPSTPPAFIWHTFEDGTVPVENSLLFADALAKNKVPFEMHIFPDGRHGLGLADTYPHVAQWTGLFINWLKDNALL